MQKRNDWFVNYQGPDKLRTLESRTQFFNESDFENSSVLDIGCNEGQMCKYARSKGAVEVLGMDYDQSIISKCLQQNSDSAIEYIADDADNFFFFSSLKSYDVVMFLSVIDTQELENRYGMLSRLCNKTNKVMYFEGHNNQPPEKYTKMLQMYTDFTCIEYLGQTFDNNSHVDGWVYTGNGKGRAFFRCSYETMDQTQAVTKIVELTRGAPVKIGVIGNGGSGKTTTRKLLEKELTGVMGTQEGVFYKEINGWYILDDVPDQMYKTLPSTDKLIYFDYRALSYEPEIKIVFNVIRNKKMRDQSRPEYALDRSPAGLTEKVLTLYTVKVS